MPPIGHCIPVQNDPDEKVIEIDSCWLPIWT